MSKYKKLIMLTQRSCQLKAQDNGLETNSTLDELKFSNYIVRIQTLTLNTNSLGLKLNDLEHSDHTYIYFYERERPYLTPTPNPPAPHPASPPHKSHYLTSFAFDVNSGQPCVLLLFYKCMSDHDQMYLMHMPKTPFLH